MTDAAGKTHRPVHAQGVQLANLLSERLVFEIPRFQRSYSWGPDDLAVFWADLQRAAFAPNADVHFVGAMVFAGDGGGQRVAVLDGQQRITTLMILLA